MMQEIRDKKILIDTNILVYCNDKGYKMEARKILRLLKDHGNTLATSWASCFELIKNAIDEKVREYCFRLINYIDNIPITPENLINGCSLYHLYHKEWGEKCKSIESMDLIIAGTIVQERGSLLLTANRKHFAMPFWKLVSQSYIMRKKDEGDELINIYLLEFDYTKIPTSLLNKNNDKI